jgi:hypothetical protein
VPDSKPPPSFPPSTRSRATSSAPPSTPSGNARKSLPSSAKAILEAGDPNARARAKTESRKSGGRFSTGRLATALKWLKWAGIAAGALAVTTSRCK